jgi:hypothetical protein
VARGAVRSALTACFGLVVLQKLTTTTGSSTVAGAVDAVNSIIKRAFDPTVAAIPDLAGGGGSTPEGGVPGYAGSSYGSLPPNPNRVPVPNGPAVPYL